jgi:hypothetical protein
MRTGSIDAAVSRSHAWVNEYERRDSHAGLDDLQEGLPTMADVLVLEAIQGLGAYFPPYFAAEVGLWSTGIHMCG